MNILVTGAAGMLGSTMCPTLRAEGHTVFATDIDLSYGDVELLDIRDIEAVRAYTARVQPDLIMNLAAETDVDKCETDPDHSFRTNAVGAQNVALICAQRNIVMVHVSTAGVFDGEKETPYIEFDAPRPRNAYGHAKLAAEQFVREHLDRYFIVRAGWMMGGGKRDKKFVHKIIQQIAAGKRELRVVDDKFGAPTYTVDFSRCMAQLIKTDYYGLYHMACRGQCSRYDVAVKILEYLGRTDITLKRISSAEFPLPATRVRSEIMRNFMLEFRGLNTMRPWDVCLKEYLEQEKDFAHVRRKQ